MEIIMGNNANKSLHESKVGRISALRLQTGLWEINSSINAKRKLGLNQNKHVFMREKKQFISRKTFAYWFKLKDGICRAGS